MGKLGADRRNKGEPDVLDLIDLGILSGLVDDSNVSVKKLAEQLEVHPNTLFLRLKRLRRNGTIVKSTAVVDYVRSGYPTEVLVWIKVRTGRGWERQLRPLARCSGVVSLLLLTGEYDALAIVRMRNDRELPAIVRRIQENPVVMKTTTQMVLDYWKRPHEFNPFRDRPEAGATASR
jgi:DNA-binding Lrp family transcriptional regulator